jgi:hypothetical protein
MKKLEELEISDLLILKAEIQRHLKEKRECAYERRGHSYEGRQKLQIEYKNDTYHQKLEKINKLIENYINVI